MNGAQFPPKKKRKDASVGETTAEIKKEIAAAREETNRMKAELEKQRKAIRADIDRAINMLSKKTLMAPAPVQAPEKKLKKKWSLFGKKKQ